MKAFSAPGKAFLAGGYLVIDPQYNAYVTALSARMHAVVSSSPADKSTITVLSPQFGGLWQYEHSEGAYSEKEGRKNPFLEATLRTVLDYEPLKEPTAINITLYSDPGYHTQQNTTEKKNNKRRFLFHQAAIDKVAKTGMGSSAGLVTVVTTALLSEITHKPLDQLTNTIHNAAQVAHCEAQKKIGSGFDVATAVYGSIIYRRFKPELLDPVLGVPLSQERTAKLRSLIDSDWHLTHEKCALPKGIRLLMGDVHAGSETPKLVSKVLAWVKLNPEEGKDLYGRINAANVAFMTQLTKFTPEKENFTSLSRALADIRAGLQELTAKTGADIEPKQQTELLDRCTQIDGCLGGVVPGAGGYDAICLLVQEEKVDLFKEATKNDLFFSNVAWLELSEEADGVLQEDPLSYAF